MHLLYNVQVGELQFVRGNAGQRACSPRNFQGARYLIFNYKKLVCYFQLHTWARLLGILLSVGGAIEVALTGYNDEPATDILPANLSNSTDTGGCVVYSCITLE